MTEPLFVLKEKHRNVSDQDLLDDLKSVAAQLGKSTLSGNQYDTLGKYHHNTIRTRFGAWNKALVAAGLGSGIEMNIDTERLFDNLREVWIKLGRQPGRRDMVAHLSNYSERPYIRRFGSWTKALRALVEYVSKDAVDSPNVQQQETNLSLLVGNPVSSQKRRTNRGISDRLRFSILLRDGFRCHACGRSPIGSPGIVLHVDHIIPWSIGGETLPDNLETKCLQCNLGKGNAFIG
jgi:5-methylcytosine-specific restriction endonuclease McrA